MPYIIRQWDGGLEKKKSKKSQPFPTPNVLNAVITKKSPRNI